VDLKQLIASSGSLIYAEIFLRER